jgi:hypothetical protein
LISFVVENLHFYTLILLHLGLFACIRMPVQTRRASKRARDDSDVSEEERAAKRPSTPFFRRTEPSFHERARSARKATPNRPLRPLKSYSEHPPARFRAAVASDLPELKPTGEEVQARGEASAPTTPVRQAQEQSTIGWLWNSAKRIITGAPFEENAPATEPQPRRTNPQEEALIPPPFPRLETPPQDYYRFLRAPPATADDYNWQKRAKRWDFAAKAIREDNPPFSTIKLPGSNKRKITEEAEEPEQLNTPPQNSFQTPYVEDDDENEPTEVTQSIKTPEPKQRQPGPTPLKSALRTGTKSKMNVDFDESTINSKWRDYGPAGHYTGTTFLDPSDLKNKNKFPNSHDDDDSDEEVFISKNPKFHQPNTFGVDDEDIEYGDLSEEEQAALDAQKLAAQTTTPKAPRPAHAELPKPFTAPEDRVAPGDTPPGHIDAGGRLFKPAAGSSLERMVQQQREKANKYKPKNSSGLARVEPARSRSSSPPRKDSTTTATADADTDVPALSDGEGSDEPTSPTPPPSQPQLGDIGANITAAQAGTETQAAQTGELDNTLAGPDGMTDYERSHQYDSWAQNLDWPAPQTYVEAGLCSAFIDDLLRKKWTKEDERITREWWGNEFQDVENAMVEAKSKGQRLELVWGDAE